MFKIENTWIENGKKKKGNKGYCAKVKERKNNER